MSQIIAISFSSDKPSLITVIHLTIKSTITVCFLVKDSDGVPVRVQAVVKRNREQDGYFLISSVCSCIVEIVGEDSNRSSRCAASLREQSAATFRRPKFCWQRDLAESANKMQTSEEKEKYELIFLFQQDPNSHNESGGWVCLEKETWTGLLLLRWQHRVSVQKKFTADSFCYFYQWGVRWCAGSISVTVRSVVTWGFEGCSPQSCSWYEWRTAERPWCLQTKEQKEREERVPVCGSISVRKTVNVIQTPSCRPLLQPQCCTLWDFSNKRDFT